MNAETYIEAAQERLKDAIETHEVGRYGASLYLSGVAAECILRGFRVIRGREFAEKHDLINLYRASRIADHLDEEQQLRLRSAIDQLRLVWRNGHRYESRRSLVRFLKAGRHDRGIKGDPFKEIGRRAANDASFVVETGVRIWMSLSRKSKPS